MLGCLSQQHGGATGNSGFQPVQPQDPPSPHDEKVHHNPQSTCESVKTLYFATDYS